MKYTFFFKWTVKFAFRFFNKKKNPTTFKSEKDIGLRQEL